MVERFRRAAAQGRLGGSFLFVGPSGIGKCTFARKLAQALLCQNQPESALNPCNTCTACGLVLASTHPDLHIVSKPPDKSFIPLETFVGERDRRMREGLIYQLSLKPFMGGRKIAIIDDADYLHAESANCLLKTLEEPPPQTIILLISTSPARQLPTIRSRCQLIRFQPLEPEVVEEILLREKWMSDPVEARVLAQLCEGSLDRARQLADPELWAFRKTLWTGLSQHRLDSVGLAGEVSAQMEAAGMEAPARRDRLRVIVGMAAEYYRQVLYQHSSRLAAHSPAPATPSDTPGSHDAQETQAIQDWPTDLTTAAECLDRCLEVAEQIDRNANLATLLECWLDDLARWMTSPRREAHRTA